MALKIIKEFSDDSICRILLETGFINATQNKEIQVKKNQIRAKLQQIRAMRSSTSAGKARMVNPVTIVDIINSMELNRADDSSKPLDEETIFQTLAKAWKIPYKKIDPLNLDMNLVTRTIPHTFSMKHLVLPIDSSDGYMTVATPNPFNMEAMSDIAQVTQMKVRAVLSTKTDIIKLIGEFFGFKRSIMAAETPFAGPTIDLGNLETFVRLRSSEEIGRAHV